ncbi:MAG: tetraacyldisaccharide 4'-kinase [Gemmatimonadaceae bacterium]|nr:tetraacyldisaccharide 4'-kinase [Gemmatimonadaceae bacterium]
MSGRQIETIWERDGAGSAVLTPLSWLYALGTAARNAAYDLGVLPTHALGAPALSVGNLTVGGTGKTPMSAWFARELLARGRRPGILLRGYGDDEPLVHRRLVPDAVVVADVDRVRGARAAAAQGATAFVLDDGFQHRRARRDLDVVLVAAEQAAAHRVLPAGPLREFPVALRRAQLLVITRKSATADEAERAAVRWAAAAPDIAVAIAALVPGGVVRVNGGATEPLATLAGRDLLAISAIGNPAAFEAQLRAAGAGVQSAAYGDHHAFTRADAEALARRLGPSVMPVCTLKDAVKLEGVWPAQAPPLWYLSQTVAIEVGGGVLSGLLDRLVAVQSS